MSLDKIIAEMRDEVTWLEAYNSDPLPKRLDKKIRTFISSIFDIDQSKLSILMVYESKHRFKTTGSMRHLDKAYILITPEYAEQLIENHALTKEAKFSFAHEMAHILHEDCIETRAHIQEESAKSGMKTIFLTVLAVGALAGTIFSAPATAFFSLATALVAGVSAEYVTECRIRQEMELARDIEAAKKSPALAEGGAISFERALHERQARRSFAYWHKQVAEQHSNPITHTVHALYETISWRRRIDSDGNDLSDRYHPFLTVRRDTCRQIAEAHTKQKILAHKEL